MTYTITITGNKTYTVENLTRNGTNYVSEAEVDTSAWPDTFTLTVTDSDENVVDHYDHARLIQQETYSWDEGKYYLAFAEIPAAEYAIINQQAQIEYIAMMTDVQL